MSDDIFRVIDTNDDIALSEYVDESPPCEWANAVSPEGLNPFEYAFKHNKQLALEAIIDFALYRYSDRLIALIRANKGRDYGFILTRNLTKVDVAVYSNNAELVIEMLTNYSYRISVKHIIHAVKIAYRLKLTHSLEALYGVLPICAVEEKARYSNATQLQIAVHFADWQRVDDIAAAQPVKFVWESFLRLNVDRPPWLLEEENQPLRDKVFAVLKPMLTDKGGVIHIGVPSDERVLHLNLFQCAMLCRQEVYVRENINEHVDELLAYEELYSVFDIQLKPPLFIAELQAEQQPVEEEPPSPLRTLSLFDTSEGRSSSASDDEVEQVELSLLGNGVRRRSALNEL